MTEKFYITTPIYYPSDNLHIGHCYTSVVADALARYHRRRGHETWFLTGTDEHGQKIERRAEAKGMTPIAFVDEIVAGIKQLWSELEISYDDFIRTTEARHEQAAQKIFAKLYEQGDIYKASYEGWYCTPDETFWPESKLGPERLCPDCGRPLELMKEESYFFRLSKYADRLLAHIDANPDFIQPVTRRNEMVSFIKQGLEDLCVSRTSVKWGIPVPFDEKHTMYVWIDALSNYITALGYGTPHDAKYKQFWPADVHLMAKEIVRFHAVIWPIILMALGEPLPKKVLGHGWLLFPGTSEKISKSRGNAVDPRVLKDRYGLDALRYYLLRATPLGQDGVYTEDALILRTNVDLANDLGNLLSRTTSMIEKFVGGTIPEYDAASDDGVLRSLAFDVLAQFEQEMAVHQVDQALATLWKLVGRANKYIEEQAPWALAKDSAKRQQLNNVLYSLAESLRITAVALTPFLVHTPEKIWDQLGLAPGAVRTADWAQAITWGGLPAGTTIRRGEPLFPRIEIEEATTVSDAPKAAAPVAPVAPTAPAAPAAPVTPTAAESPAAYAAPEGIALIEITDFQKVELRVAKVVAAEKVPKADKLLKLQLEVGDETRQIVSGIAQHYTPEELVGKNIILVANLKPAKLRGVESQGMLLAASTPDGQLTLCTTEKPIASGARVK